MTLSINLRNLFSPCPLNIVVNDLSQNVINNDVMSERNTFTCSSKANIQDQSHDAVEF